MSRPNKIAIVTGGSRGIGAAICGRLALDGLNVVVNYSGDAAPTKTLLRSIEDAGGKGMAFKCDVSDPVAVSGMFDDIERALGPVDVLINNAGVMPLGTIAEMDDGTFDRLVAINFAGAFYNMREAAKRLPDGGRIVNLSSSVVGLLQPTYGVYAATKAAVEAMTHVLSKELRGRGITVNAVAPGPTATSLFMDGKSQQLIDTIASMNPLERLGTPEDIAHVVSFLVSSEGGWINGQVLRANGGMI